MARPRTVERVHAAVLSLAESGGPQALTMEGIAAAAGVGKQTLYRNWPSVHAVLFDALAHEDASPDAPAPDATIPDLLRATIEEITTEPRASLLRALAATIQTEAEVAREFHERLLQPQLHQIQDLVAAAGYPNPQASTELLLAPILYRWFLRLPALADDDLHRHAERVLDLDL